MKPIEPTPYGVKTAWADPEHMRLTLPPPDERVNPPQTVRRKGVDPDDPWATNSFGVIPTPQERQRARLRWDALFTDADDRGRVALGLTIDARHYSCGAWQVDGSDLICECGEKLFVLWAVS